MASETTSIESLLRQRTELIISLSQANADHMRMLQSNSGMEVLLMQDPKSAEHIKNKEEAESKLSSSQNHIQELESRLAVIDKNIETTMNTEV